VLSNSEQNLHSSELKNEFNSNLLYSEGVSIEIEPKDNTTIKVSIKANHIPQAHQF